MFKSWRVGGLVAVLALAVTAGAYAMRMPMEHHGSMSNDSSSMMHNGSMMSSDTEHAMGTIARIDTAKNELVVRTGNVHETFRIADSTSYVEQGRQLKATDLKPGDEVLVDWSAQNGHDVAAQVKVLRSAS